MGVTNYLLTGMILQVRDGHHRIGRPRDLRNKNHRNPGCFVSIMDSYSQIRISVLHHLDDHVFLVQRNWRENLSLFFVGNVRQKSCGPAARQLTTQLHFEIFTPIAAFLCLEFSVKQFFCQRIPPNVWSPIMTADVSRVSIRAQVP